MRLARPTLCAGLALTLALAAGCSTLSRTGNEPSTQSLAPVPKVPAGHLRADRAILAAFFAANGIRMTRAQAEAAIPATAPRGRMDRGVLREIASQHNRILMVVKADELYLWDELQANQPLLLLLPPGTTYCAAATPLIPIAWNRDAQSIDLLDGNEEIHTLSESDFFSRREPLKHAALALMKPSGVGRIKPTREQKMLLADFWFHKGFYRRAEAVYTAIQEAEPEDPNANAEALIGKGNILIRKGRFKEAIPVYKSALMLDPDNAQLLNNLAYAMLHGGDELLPALRHANKALSLDKENPLILETLGTINLRLGDAPMAARQFETAWARSLKRPPEIQIAIMDQLVRAWIANHREDLAWQVATYRQQAFPAYRFPQDILQYFPALRLPQSQRPDSPPPPPQDSL